MHKKPEVQAKPQTLSKKEQKKKELEELDKILGEMGRNLFIIFSLFLF